MCYLIHLGVSEQHARSVHNQRVPRVEPHENPSVSAAFGPSMATFCVVDGQCSCHLYSTPDAGGDEDQHRANMRRKYQRLGWSETKIERALGASAEASAQNRRAAGLRGDVVEYVTNLVGVTGEVRLYVHDYRGSFAEEPVRAQGTRKMSASELGHGGSAAIEEDVVYVIRP